MCCRGDQGYCYWLPSLGPAARPGNGLSIVHVQLDFTSCIVLDLDLVGSWISMDKKSRIIQSVLDLSPDLDSRRRSTSATYSSCSSTAPSLSGSPCRSSCSTSSSYGHHRAARHGALAASLLTPKFGKESDLWVRFDKESVSWKEGSFQRYSAKRSAVGYLL
jgi:hypothetical protein